MHRPLRKSAALVLLCTVTCAAFALGVARNDAQASQLSPPAEATVVRVLPAVSAYATSRPVIAPQAAQSGAVGVWVGLFGLALLGSPRERRSDWLERLGRTRRR